ncbi:cation diffusion facilitator family transporter [Sulfobacillus thermosulfidooxidans]|uniref:cation diffusion facilitator family transporter n=1 Tax=Sulfobacillus thermosulfidooxidans TaxID=28034 RepID=UPI0006B4348F|nr:cation diffusion facilitator family transporter [Sulfobacillus thermosulfidooxidans]
MVDVDGELQSSTKSAIWGALGNFLLMALKIIVGIVGNSRALIADGIHSGADLGSSIAVIVGLKVSRIPPDEDHNYGHAKAEAVAQKVVALLLILAGFEVANGAIQALGHSFSQHPTILTLVVSAAVMLVKWIMYARQKRMALKTGSHSLMASALDNRMDVISSGITTAAILGAQWGIPHFDSYGALAVAVLIVWLGIEIFSQAANDLMDRAADPRIVEAIREVSLQVPGVKTIDEIRTRVAGTQVLVDLKIVVDRHLSLLEAHRIAHRVKDAVMAQPRIQDVMVHVNPD